LATILAHNYFPTDNDVVSLLLTLATFATGFIVRPFGALFFGRIGDLIGRKYTFSITLLIMGGATAIIGLLPTYQTIGIAAPIILLFLRLLQGLALGGEYGGAATYVAEHSPDNRRGFFTSFIQTTATLGLFMSLGVILATRYFLGEEAFEQWGWRIPFLLSSILVVISFLIRQKLHESPVFQDLKDSGKASRAPIRESFLNPQNRRLVIIALLGATMGQGVVWYTGQFYALYYLQTVLMVDFVTANYIVAAALLLAAPWFILFGALSDKIGRKKIMMSGCFLAAVFYIPIYKAMASASGYNIDNPTLPFHEPDIVQLVLLVYIQVLFVTMVYGPIAAFLVELFPTKIRYTSMSLPYHVGNGVFGGLVPLISTYLVENTGNMYAGLYYPISIALITLFIGTIFINEKNHQVSLAQLPI
jgi:MFS family permease